MRERGRREREGREGGGEGVSCSQRKESCYLEHFPVTWSSGKGVR